MGKVTFESWLQIKFIELHPEYLDDEIPDAFDYWMESLGPDEWVTYAQKWGDGLSG